MTHRLLRGHIAYTSLHPDRIGKERGREWWTITTLPDGGRTLQTYTEIDDAPAVVRWVTLSVDPEMRPTDAFVRIAVRGRTVGSTWYNFGPTFAACEGQTVTEGRLSQYFERDRPLLGLGTHPLQGDAWHMSAVPVDQGPGPHKVRTMITSLDHRGATGPSLIPLEVDVTYVGRESVTVGAGTFDAHHFSLGAEGAWADDDLLRHPTYDAWISADGDWLLLKCEVGGYMRTRYELTSLDHA